MKALVSCSQYVALVDLDTSKNERVREGGGLYWGLTFDEQHVYVVSWGSRGEPAADGQQDRLILLDRETLEYRGQVDLPTEHAHGALSWAPGRIFLADTGNDRLVDLDDRGVICRQWQAPPVVRRPSDAYPRGPAHINYVTRDPRGYLCVLHCGGPSKVWRPGREWSAIPGRDVHDVAVLSTAQSVTVSSGTGEMFVHNIGAARDVAVTIGGYPRGLAATEGCMVVGVSASGPRETRARGRAHLAVLSPRRGWHVQRRIGLPGAGQVHQVRFLDVPDYAHPRET